MRNEIRLVMEVLVRGSFAKLCMTFIKILWCPRLMWKRAVCYIRSVENALITITELLLFSVYLIFVDLRTVPWTLLHGCSPFT